MILVDTSVWIGHLRSNNSELEVLLRNEEVLIHPFVIGELACGSLRRRNEILQSLHALPHAQQAENDEVFGLLESRKLWGRGLGWVDAHLLASALLSHARLWSIDKRLVMAAFALKLAR